MATGLVAMLRQAVNVLNNLREEGTYYFCSQVAFEFQSGARISELELVYECYGTLNAARDNVILIHHALSSSCHVRSHEKNPTPGWWENMVGPNKPIDTEKYFIICINNLGSCFGSSGPASIDSKTKNPYRLSFPEVTMIDMIRSQHLLLEHLGIKKLYAIVSASMGAMLSLAWALYYPAEVKRLVTISSCARTYPLNRAIRAIKRDIICLDPLWNNGDYNITPLPGFTLARKVGHLSYRDADQLNTRFINENEGENPRTGILNYLQYNAEKFTKKFDANSYLYLMRAMDLYDVVEKISMMQAYTLVVAVSSDSLFPPSQQHEIFDCLVKNNKSADYILHKTSAGHDAFLIETIQFGEYIKMALEKEMNE